MISVLLGFLILPSTVTTTVQLAVLWISAISSFLHISVCGWRWYHQRSPRCEICVADVQ